MVRRGATSEDDAYTKCDDAPGSEPREQDPPRWSTRPIQPAVALADERLLVGLEEAASMLGYTSIGLRKIVNRSRDKANGKTTGGPTIRFFQTCKSAPIKFRIEWIRDFIERYSVDPDAHDEASKRAAARRRASRPGLREGQYDHGF